jgi:hypothetical protein
MTENGKDWRLVNLPDQSNKLRNFLEIRKKIKQLDSVAAAVSRCEAVLENVQLQNATNGEEQEANTELTLEESPSKGPLPEANKSTPAANLLLTLMKEESALKEYLDTAEDSDPVQAFAHAKGDVAYLNRLRSSDLLMFSSKKALGKVFLPIFIVLLTAVSANVVGVILQRQSLQNNRTFEVKLERLREGQRLAGNLYASVADFQRRTERDEARKELALKPIGSLNDFNRELRQIRNMVAGATTDEVNAALVGANNQVNDTIKCFEHQPKNPKDASSSCSENFKLEPFDDLQDSISAALVNYLE